MTNHSKYNELKRQRSPRSVYELRNEIRFSDAAIHYRGDAIEVEPDLARDFAEFVSAQLGFEVPIGHEDREVYVMPFPGHYGLSGYVITVNGSPTRATILVNLSPWLNVAASVDGRTFNWGRGDTRVGAKRIKFVSDFLESLGLSLETGAVAQAAGCRISPRRES